MKNYTYLLIIIITLFTVSCIEKNAQLIPSNPKTFYLDHHILNDSIHYKVKEIELKNKTKRSLIIYNKDILLSETPIYYFQKKVLKSEDYYKVNKTNYTISNKLEITIKKVVTHYNNYKVEHIDSTITKLVIDQKGDLK